MSPDTCRPSFVACLRVLAPVSPGFLVALRCVAQNPMILLTRNLIQWITATPVLPSFCFPCYFLIATRCTAHWHFNRVQVQAWPTGQAAQVLTFSFSRGYDPYTHACKARPLTTVGRTSLSVIIIIFVENSQKSGNGSSGGSTVEKKHASLPLRSLVHGLVDPKKVCISFMMWSAAWPANFWQWNWTGRPVISYLSMNVIGSHTSVILDVHVSFAMALWRPTHTHRVWEYMYVNSQ